MLKSNRFSVIVLIFGLLLSLSSCFENSQEKKIPIARVFDKYLYSDDINNLFPAGINRDDSIKIINAYIERWIRHELLLYRAENNLNEQQKDVAKQLEDYRSSLLIFKYEQEYIFQKLDTSITMEEVENFYIANTSNFILDQTVVKALFIKIRKDTPYLNKIKELYKSSKDEDIKSLDDLAYQVAIKYDYFNDRWIPFEALQREFPYPIEDPDEYLKRKESIELEDGDNIYLISIRSVLFKGLTSPLDYEVENIKSIIINKRKQKLINDLENGIYNDALDRKNCEILLK